MKIDLHIHTSTGSDGSLTVEEVFKEAKRRNLGFMSITDHDSTDAQHEAVALAREDNIRYVTGVELNVTFPYPGREVSLDFLGYRYDIDDHELNTKLRLAREHREKRARQILDNLNAEFDKEKITRLTEEDFRKVQDAVDGAAFGRPHIADLLVEKGIVKDRQEAFDKYLVRLDVPKYQLSLAEASRLVRDAGGRLVFAHSNDPGGTSLATITTDLTEQSGIIEEYMLEYIDGIECWHPAHDGPTVLACVALARKHHLLMTGGSDCHQKPVIMGTVDVPKWVVGQFKQGENRSKA